MDSNFIKNKYLDFYLFAGYKNDYVHSKYIENGGTFDPKIAEWLINNVKPGWTVYDVGANMFEFTEISARLSGRSGMVFSFEPQKDLFGKYLMARKRNTYKDVADIYLHNFGLGSSNEIKKFMINVKNLGGSTFEDKFVNYSNDVSRFKDWKETEFQIKRADSIDLPTIVPDLIKVDIEGGEENFWIGCPSFIKESKFIIMEIGKYTSKNFVEQVSHGRKMYDIHTGEKLGINSFNNNYQIDVLFF